MKDQTEYLKEQGYKAASETAELIIKCMLQKEEEGDLRTVRDYTQKEKEEILNRKVELLMVERTYKIKYFSLIMGDPNNPKERRLFILQVHEMGNHWDLWEVRETDILPFLRQDFNHPYYSLSFSSFLRLKSDKKEGIMI